MCLSIVIYYIEVNKIIMIYKKLCKHLKLRAMCYTVEIIRCTYYVYFALFMKPIE